jgi:hypothetical protein
LPTCHARTDRAVRRLIRQSRVPEHTKTVCSASP